jgi:hypothetical protein
MARLAFFAALAVGAGVVLGCGPAKELPDDVPGKSPEPTEQPTAVPKTSEPAAKAYLVKAVAAFTGNKPELVEKGKVARLSLKGKMLMPAEGQKVLADATRTVAAVWPDRIHATTEVPVQKLTVGMWLRRPHLTVRNGQEEVALPNRAEYEQNLVADFVGQFWSMFLIPLADPKAVAYDLRTQNQSLASGQSIEIRTLSLALGDLPAYQFTFDAKTDNLLRVEYASVELSVKHRKQWLMADHKAGPEGLMLPSKMEFRQDNVPGEDWEVEKWEFPASIPDDEFNPPQKK